METMKITEAQIAEWKAQYGEILELEMDEMTAYCRKPNRLAWSRAEKMAQSSTADGNITLVTDCWLGGDETLKRELRYINAIANTLMEEIKPAQVVHQH